MDSHGHSTTETEDDVYVNTEEWHPKSKKCPDASEQTELKGNMKTVKLFISVFGLLVILGALSTLCAVGVLYYNKVLSYKSLSEKYANVTATLMMQENNTKANQNRQCKDEWKSLGLKCYYFSTEKLNWAKSKDYCVEKGGHLVIITSQAEQSSVSSQIKKSHWIGLNDLETEGKWMWVNNQPLKNTDVKFWYISPKGLNEPDNWKKEDPSGENCAALGHENGSFHKWFDASCRKLKLFICEK
ncbi:C-type lectin domain family 6 member A-like [Clarias gariepinus]|uniref:C-type lectin domain family 6 member A-like n=1 Tax=Clarias gariepinus TaxID=13013 RepID=UPI00234C48DB|nr:C-type lectin domain family 6 member A-like [Clarias gariepinus]